MVELGKVSRSEEPAKEAVEKTLGKAVVVGSLIVDVPELVTTGGLVVLVLIVSAENQIAEVVESGVEEITGVAGSVVEKTTGVLESVVEVDIDRVEVVLEAAVVKKYTGVVKMSVGVVVSLSYFSVVVACVVDVVPWISV